MKTYRLPLQTILSYKNLKLSIPYFFFKTLIQKGHILTFQNKSYMNRLTSRNKNSFEIEGTEKVLQ